MSIKNNLRIRLGLVNNQVELYKKNAIKEIEKEEIIPATSSLLMLRDLKEQQGLIKKLLDEEEEWNNDNSKSR